MATVQGRPAIWVHSIHDVVERIAQSLAPLPISAGAAAPVVPGAWVGTVSEVGGKSGRAIVTGWLIVDTIGSASMCDDQPADATECTGPTFLVDWYTPGSGPPCVLSGRAKA